MDLVGLVDEEARKTIRTDISHNMNAVRPQILIENPDAASAQNMDMSTQNLNEFGAMDFQSSASNQAIHGSVYADNASNSTFSGHGEYYCSSLAGWTSDGEADFYR